MAHSLNFDLDYMTDFLVNLLKIPSPTGMAGEAVAYTAGALKAFPVEQKITNKGTLVAGWAGQANTVPRALTAHVDTLGDVQFWADP